MLRHLKHICERFPVYAFCLLVFSISWSAYFIYHWIQANSGRPFLHYIIVVQFSPAIAAIILVAATQGKQGFAALFRSLTTWRVGLGWLFFAVLFEPLLFIAIALSYWTSIGNFPEFSLAGLSSSVQTLCFTFVTGLFRWGFAEEIGWRGWMYPKLLRGMSPFKASLTLATVITLWHFNPASFPDLFVIKESQWLFGSYPPMFERLLTSIPITLLMTIIYHKTGGSLLAMMCFHSASNTSYFWLNGTFGVVDTTFFRISFLIVLLVMAVVLTLLVLRKQRPVDRPL